MHKNNNLYWLSFYVLIPEGPRSGNRMRHRHRGRQPERRRAKNSKLRKTTGLNQIVLRLSKSIVIATKQTDSLGHHGMNGDMTHFVFLEFAVQKTAACILLNENNWGDKTLEALVGIIPF